MWSRGSSQPALKAYATERDRNAPRFPRPGIRPNPGSLAFKLRLTGLQRYPRLGGSGRPGGGLGREITGAEKPVSALWKVTRSTMAARTSVGAWALCGRAAIEPL